MDNKYEGAEGSELGRISNFVLGNKEMDFMIDFFTNLLGTVVIDCLDEDD